MASPLQIGPIRLDQEIAPANPDEAGMISGPAGARYDVQRIIEAVQADAERIRPALALPPDVARSLLITEMLDYVNGIVSDAYPDLTVEGASVRGTGGDERKRLVVYTARHTSTRSTKGVMPYAKFPKVEEAYQAKVRQDVATARAAKAGGGSEEEHGEDPRVRILQEELSRVQAEKESAEKAAQEAQEAAKEAVAVNPPPYEGYDDATVDGIRARIEGVADVVDRELLKRQIRSYEGSQEKPRKGVMEITEPVALAPVKEGD